MISCLLKRALPFTLALVFGAALGGLFHARRAQTWTWAPNATRGFGHEGPFGDSVGCGNRSYGMRRHNLVAESKQLVILFKPEARLPREFSGTDDGALFRFVPRSALARVTFGADGKVQAVEPFYENSLGLNRLPLGPPWQKAWDNVERAARQIQFTPETINSVPVSVTKELEIFFFKD